MAGNYPNLISAIQGLAAHRGVSGFYKGWWPGLVGKIPSYALTWTFFQQLKEARDKLTGRPATDFENIIMGCIASGTTVCIMIPLDTIKTRLVTQSAHALSDQAYKGIIDCAVRVAREEGVRALYRGLTPRLISVVPMIGIQFGVYEFMKKTLLDRSDLGMAALPPPGQLRQRPRVPSRLKKPPALALPDDVPSKEEEQSTSPPIYGTSEALQEAAMEVAASPEVPFPAPRFLKRKLRIETQTKLKIWKENGRKRKETNKR
jgi:solute carrier family 25 S-adenosylmethionine transporter 26